MPEVDKGEGSVTVHYEDRLDEQSKSVLESIPDEAVDLSDIPRLRKTLDVLVDAMFADAPDPQIYIINHFVFFNSW